MDKLISFTTHLIIGLTVGAVSYWVFEDTLTGLNSDQKTHAIILCLVCSLFARLTALSATRSAEARIRNIYPLANMPEVEPVFFYWVMGAISTWIILGTANDLVNKPLFDFSLYLIFEQIFTSIITCIAWAVLYANRYSMPMFDAFSARHINPLDNNYD